MKTRTWMLMGALLVFSVAGQTHEQTPSKPPAIKVSGQAKFDLKDLTATAAPRLACDNSATQAPPAATSRARAGKAPKAAPVQRIPRRVGCDSFHCVARATGGLAADAALIRSPV